MSYTRVVNRNHLRGNYDYAPDKYPKSLIAGDLRRLERDTRDDRHLAAFAALAGVTPEQVSTIFDAFFEGDILIDQSVNREIVDELRSKR